ncbi:MAG: hypothetical protein ACJ741_03020 [Pyrinomonadaceae bacterium]
MRDIVQWTTPAPLWGAAAGAEAGATRRAALQRPAILRFATDAFMQDVLALLENDPARLGTLVAQPETWRDLVSAPAPVQVAPKFALPLQRLRLAAENKRARLLGAAPSPEVTSLSANANAGSFRSRKPRTLKLYQPAHQRYYMVASCLVCGRAGLPDKALDRGREESTTFVIRRMFPASVVNASGQTVPFVNPLTGAVDSSIPLPAFDATWEEYAHVSTPEGDAGWQRVSGALNATGEAVGDVLVEGEEPLPLFPLNYTDDAGRRRRLLAGLVPVGKREAYMGAASLLQSQLSAAAMNAAASGGATQPENEIVDPRMMALWRDVTEPWKVLLQRADAARAAVEPDKWTPSHAVSPAPPSTDKPMDADDPNAKTASIKATRELIQTGSWYILLDFAKYLEENLPSVWAAITAPGASSPAALSNDPPALAVYNALHSTKLANWRAKALELKPLPYPTAKVKKNLVAALRAIALEDTSPTAEDRLESAKVSYNRDKIIAGDTTFPSFLFPLAHAELDAAHPTDEELAPLPVVTLSPATITDESKLDVSGRKIDALADLIKLALAPRPAPVASSLPLAAQKPMDTREGFFRIRCVYQRPLCGPIDPPLLSAPTREFQLAGFFDPDAPARPIRIGLPIDTSPAGLRKFDKNTAFMMSDMLCGQVARMKGLTLGDLIRTVLPWPLHKDLSVPDGGACVQGGLEVGMICSLSIPIITICALILLMIIVSLLDIIFHWMPFFLICFPLPGFASKAKGAS